ADLDHWHDGVADDVALPGREGVHDIARRGHQRHAFGGGRRGVHVVEPGPLGRRLRRLEHVDIGAGAPDLLEIAERLLLDGGETAGDVALGRLGLREVVLLVRLDDLVHVGLPPLVPLLADLRGRGPRLGDVLAAGDFRGLAEHAVDALRDQLVVHVADRRAGGEAGRGVALAAFGRDPQLGEVALLALELGRRLQIVLGDPRGLGDRHDVARAFDAEAGDRLAGLL